MATVTIFSTALGALLLFLIQPMLGKALLPIFGGTASTWIVCMMFFQAALFLGYLYSHILASFFSRKAQFWIHSILVLVSLFQLPLTIRLISLTAPSWAILAALSASAFLVYLVLSTSAPLLQSWGSRSGALGTRNIYALYAISNLASFAALAIYPLLIEPKFDLELQRRIWSLLYLCYAVSVAAIILISGRGNFDSGRSQLKAALSNSPIPGQFLWWVCCSFGGNFLLLSVTNSLCLDIAPVPLLWTAPLSLFLLSYVMTFTGGRLLSVSWIRFFCVGVVAFGLSIYQSSFALQVGAHLFLLFSGCMICHVTLYEKRPPDEQLTPFYFAIALGGLLAGVTGAMLLPHVFNWFGELYVALGLCLLIDIYRTSMRAGLILSLLFAPIMVFLSRSPVPAVSQNRNFFGVVRIIDESIGPLSVRSIVQGSIRHGYQILQGGERNTPTAYFCRSSLAGQVLSTLPPDASIGIIGLGAGTLASYGRNGDRYTFFEINPQVIGDATTYFSFLKSSKAVINVIPGDARLSLRDAPAHSFDVLIVDAFSGDAIPVHLITLEALTLYRRLLRADGKILIHISNRYLDLRPVVAAGARELGLFWGFLKSRGTEDGVCYDAVWSIITPTAIDRPLDQSDPPAGFRPWSDDYSNLLAVISTHGSGI